MKIFIHIRNNKERKKRIIEKAVKDLKLNKVKEIHLYKNFGLKNDAKFDFKNNKIFLHVGNELPLNENIIYHELGHVYDIIYNKIKFRKEFYKLPSITKIISGIILNSNLDGRLEKKYLPHISKKERIYESKKFFLKWNKKHKSKIDVEKIEILIKKMWGKNLSKKEILKTAERFLVKTTF